MIIRAVLNGPLKKDGTQPIKIRVTYQRRTIYIHTNKSIKPKDFDAKAGLAKSKCPNESDINNTILSYLQKLTKATPLVEPYIQNLDIRKIKQLLLSYSEDKYISVGEDNDFYQVSAQVLIDMELDGQTGNAENLQCTRNILKKFDSHEQLPFDYITPDFIKSFRRWYVPKYGKEVSYNRHLRYIKRVFNEAFRKKIISRDLNPFDYIAIPQQYKAEIRCLDASIIRTVYEYEEPNTGRDLFLLSFFFCGMNAIDIMDLPYSEGYIDTERHKTRHSPSAVRLRLKIQPEAQDIIKRYPDPDKKKLVKLPYKNPKIMAKEVKRHLDKICDAKDITKFSYIYARHSFATIAGSLKIPDSVIDKGLMHSSNKVIERYRKFDYSILDNAVRRVIDWTLYGIRKWDN